jgi:hypothetical protein
MAPLPQLHELKQAARAMCACLEALRHFAGSGEASTLLMRREVFARNGDAAVCAAMRAHPTDMEVQRQGLRCLRNLSFGGRDEGEQHRNKMIKADAHVRTATALRLYLSVEHEPEKQFLSTSLHEAAMGVVRNLAFGSGPGSEVGGAGRRWSVCGANTRGGKARHAQDSRCARCPSSNVPQTFKLFSFKSTQF